MAAVSIQVPYPVFYDRDGLPLDSGRIYIGEANLDPITNPITVYYDEALTIPASQPLITSAGYIYRNGTPTQIYVDAVDFSITVSDNKNLLVYSFPSGTGLGVGAASIEYDPPFTGAVTSGYTVADKLEQYVSVKDFGAVGDGVTDDTAAIQAAIDALTPNGGQLLIPAGTYRLNSTLTYANPASTDMNGISFMGDGRDSTILKSYIANGPILSVIGTLPSGSGSRFINGGGLYGLRFDGTNATGTADGLLVQGWQYAEISDCYFGEFPRDGIRQYITGTFPNADYSSSSINISDTWIWNCTGVGVNQTGAIGAWSWAFSKVLIGYCGLGANITSAGNSFTDCSFVGNGFDDAGTPLSGGSHLQIGSSSGGTNRILIQGCEFDFARLAHVKLDYCSTINISQSRFIFNDRNSTGTLTPSVGGVVIAPAAAASNVSQVEINNCNVRIDTAGTCNAFVMANTSNVADISVSEISFSNNAGATLNRFVGFTGTSNLNVRNDYYAADKSVNIIIPGKPNPEYIGNATSATVPNSANILFGTQETVNGQIFGTAFYNAATGVFTCPNRAYYDINFSVCVEGALAAEYYQIRVNTSAGTATEFQFAGNGLARTMMQGYVRLYLADGDTIAIYNAGANGKNITAGFSQLVIKQV